MSMIQIPIERREPVMRWIPVTERLPERGVYVLATLEWGEITMAERLGEDKWFIYEGTANAVDSDIIAWMSLPEPWEGDKSK